MVKVESSAHNYELWQAEWRIKEYRTRTGLQPAEQAIFDSFQAQMKSGFTLDLGVGCGRTSPCLDEYSGEYLGTDYSSKMIEWCRELHPKINFDVLDARDMSRFEDESVDFVVFSFNGLDCVGHDDRLLIFKEVHRVLKPSGRWIFSAHNRNYSKLAEVRNPWSSARLTEAKNPSKTLRVFARYVLAIASHQRLKGSEVENEEYAIFNDQTNRFREFMYYITPEAQRQQLAESDFELESAWNRDGKAADLAADDGGWVYYVCKKAS